MTAAVGRTKKWNASKTCAQETETTQRHGEIKFSVTFSYMSDKFRDHKEILLH